MKKTTKTTTTTQATPAPLPVKKTAVKPAKIAESLPEAKPAAAKPVTIKPAVKTAPSSVVTTKIVALIDVGFGNTLYIRGEGPGLSWEKGIPSIASPTTNGRCLCLRRAAQLCSNS